MAGDLLDLSEDELNLVIDYLPPNSILPFALTCRRLYTVTKPSLDKHHTLTTQFSTLNLTAHPFVDPLVLDSTLSVQPPGYHPVQVLELALRTPLVLKYVRKVRVVGNRPQRQKWAGPDADGTQPRTKFFSTTGELRRLKASDEQRRMVSILAKTLKFTDDLPEDKTDWFEAPEPNDDEQEQEQKFQYGRGHEQADNFHQSLTVLLCFLTNLEVLEVCCPDGFNTTWLDQISSFLSHRAHPSSTLAYHAAAPIPAGFIAHDIHTLVIRGQYINTHAPEIDLTSLVHIFCLPTLRTLDCEGIRARQSFKWPVELSRKCALETCRIEWSYLDVSALGQIISNAPGLRLVEYSELDFWDGWDPTEVTWQSPPVWLYAREFVMEQAELLEREKLVIRRRRIEGQRVHGRLQIFRKGCPPLPTTTTTTTTMTPVGVTHGARREGGGEQQETAGEEDIEWIYSDFNDDVHIELARQVGPAMPEYLWC